MWEYVSKGTDLPSNANCQMEVWTSKSTLCIGIFQVEFNVCPF